MLQKIKAFLLALPFLFIAIDSWATDYSGLGKPIKYVLASATGTATGDDWTNAYTALPATLTRDTVYFVGDGDYPEVSATTAESAAEYIYIVKASIDDHGTATGWLDSYGDGQALFETTTGGSVFYIATNYWVIDGKYRASPATGYGFKIKNSVPTSTVITKGITVGGNTNINLAFIEVEHRGSGIADVGDDLIYAAGPGKSNINVSYSYLHSASKNGVVLYGSDIVFDHVYIADIKGGGSTHAQGFQIFGASSNYTIKNSLFKNIAGTAVIAMAWGMDGLQVYNNVFWQPDATYSTSPATIVDISEAGETGVTNAQIYHNTFFEYSAATGHPGVVLYLTSNSATNSIKNNLFVDCAEVNLSQTTASHDYNHFVNSSRAVGTNLSANESSYAQASLGFNTGLLSFVPTVLGDYVGAGETLGSPFDVDANGRTRGTPTLGAYEYVAADKRYAVRAVTNE